jgi:S-methylmethionine-dependent homocysteine/selenocysteine methylase
VRDLTRVRNLPARLSSGEIFLLDAAMGTDLDRRGLATTLPLWSALGLIERPELVRQIHEDNLRAGAEAIITDTFRTTGRTLVKAGLDPSRAAELDALAVRLAIEAREATGREDAFVAGSIAPLEDCYSPWLMPEPETTLTEHRAQARNLAEAGADFIMVETMPCIAEAVLALQAARETGLDATVGFVCAPAGTGEAPRLLSGETLAAAVAAVERLAPAAILVNCADAATIAAAIGELHRLTALPVGGYANFGAVDDERGWQVAAGIDSEVFAEGASAWLESGATIIGGCCGTGPEHTAALRRMIDRRAGQGQPV